MITSFADYKPIFEVDINNLITECINDPVIEDTIIGMNLGQLWDGKGSTGEDLRPYYSEDPYFKSKESAERYKKWKKVITPNSRRYDDAPNLFINGYFYRQITIARKNNMMQMDVGNSALAMKIVDKYPLALGLTEENENKLTWDFLFDLLGIKLKKQMKIA